MAKKNHYVGSFTPQALIPVSGSERFFDLKMALAGKSPETQRKYLDWVYLFYRDVIGIEMNDPSMLPIDPFVTTVTPAAVEAWLGRYAASGHSKSGMGQARAAIVFLARMLVLSKQASSNLWHDLRLVSLPDNAATAAYGESAGEDSGARWLSPQEVHALGKAAKVQARNPNRAARDYALIWVMVTLGLRREEAAGLQWQNLNRRGGNWVFRVRGKRNKWRAVNVPLPTIDAMQPWAELIGTSVGNLPPGLVFRRVYKSSKIAEAGITGNAVWRIITEAWAGTGMPGDLAPHDLRRTAAAIALEAGANEREIQQMLGHSSIETTHRYLAPLRENTASYRIAEVLSRQTDNFWG